jgi:spore coat protein U-like protein
MRGFLLTAFAVLAAAFAFSLSVGVSPVRAGSCAATTMSNVNFGSPAVLAGGAVSTTATLSISCTSVSAGTYTYCLSLGPGSGGVSGSYRLMTAGGATIEYNLYQDAAHTLPWGSRTNSSLGTVPSITLNEAATFTASYTVYAAIAAGQTTVSPGSYSSSFSGSTETDFFQLKSGQTDCMTGTIRTATTQGAPAFTVNATPVAACLLTTNPLPFGSAGLLTSAIAATTTLGVQCTDTTPYNVSLNPGQATGATVTSRKMTSGANTVGYGLYRDSAHTLNWGQTIGTDTEAGTGTGLVQALTVYGLVPVQTTPAPGSYADTVVATVTY